ncbi:MAG: biopolymer transporter ExbD [Planctomycetota bacterium]|nr:MAG: biopolymer transporter ExbD [Planctomycetota bacterium]
MIRAPRATTDTAIEITPMIDMVFLLLIFFLVATTFHQTERELDVALPQAAAAAPISAALREIVINVAADGSIVVAGEPVEPERLREMLESAVAANPEQKVSVRGDRGTPYANVVRVLDVCKAAGVQTPFLDTVPSP